MILQEQALQREQLNVKSSGKNRKLEKTRRKESRQYEKIAARRIREEEKYSEKILAYNQKQQKLRKSKI